MIPAPSSVCAGCGRARRLATREPPRCATCYYRERKTDAERAKQAAAQRERRALAPKRKPAAPNDPVEARALRAWNNGCTLERVGAILGVTAEGARRWLASRHTHAA